MDYVVGIYLFFLSLILYSFFYKHLLMTLISLEFIIVMVTYNIYMYMYLYTSEFNMVYFLIFSVSESVLGLCLIVILLRVWGMEFNEALNMKMW